MDGCTTIVILAIHIKLHIFLGHKILNWKCASFKLRCTMQDIKPVFSLLHRCCTEIIDDHINDFRVTLENCKMESHVPSIWFLIFYHCNFPYFILGKFINYISHDIFSTVKCSSLQNVPVLVNSYLNELFVGIVALYKETKIVFLDSLKKNLVLVRLVRSHWFGWCPAILREIWLQKRFFYHLKVIWFLHFHQLLVGINFYFLVDICNKVRPSILWHMLGGDRSHLLLVKNLCLSFKLNNSSPLHVRCTDTPNPYLWVIQLLRPLLIPGIIIILNQCISWRVSYLVFVNYYHGPIPIPLLFLSI